MNVLINTQYTMQERNRTRQALTGESCAKERNVRSGLSQHLRSDAQASKLHHTLQISIHL